MSIVEEEDEVSLLKLCLARRNTTVANILRIEVPVPLILSVGEAADIQLPLTTYTAWDDNKRHTDLATAHKWFDGVADHTDFDQLILETANGKDYWIHVSCRRNRRANRHQVIRYLKK